MTAPTPAGRHAGTEGDPPSRVPGLLMGLGLGGLLDAVVLHQILQWHHMLSDTDGNSVTTLGGEHPRGRGSSMSPRCSS